MFKQKKRAYPVLEKTGAKKPGFLAAFSLIEVMVALILIGLGITFSLRAFIAGSRFIRVSDYRAEAMQVASGKMKEFLAKSYDELGNFQANPSMGHSGDGKITWWVYVSDVNETGPGTGGFSTTIPYKKIKVLVSYPTTKPDGGRGDDGFIALYNIVPYPRMRVFSTLFNSGAEFVYCPECQDYSYDMYQVWDLYVSEPIANNDTHLAFSLQTKSSFLVFYNANINIENASGLTPDDTITLVLLIYGEKDNAADPVRASKVTVPILKQQGISGYEFFPGMPPAKQYHVFLYGYKNANHGTITLKNGSLTVLQTEE